MQAQLVITHDPFHPMRGREARIITAPVRIRDLAPQTTKPFVCLRNGQVTLRKDWDDRVIDGEYVAFVTVPQGGGGGSNPLRLIAMIAVMVFAPYAAGLMTSTFMGFQVATAVIGMVGMALVNALIPPPKPLQTAGTPGLPSASPTYSIQAQGNTARLEAPIPVQYGRLRFFPDFAAQPYAEYYGNEQYLYQLFVLGQGEFDVEAIQIEDTPIDSWQDITYTLYGPGQIPTMFPSNVVTSGEVAGQEAFGVLTGTYQQTTTTITVYITGHGLLPGDDVNLDFTSGSSIDGAYEVVTAANDSFTVTATDNKSASGNVTLYKYLGPFVANAAATDANYIGIDVVFPSGLFYYDANGNINSQTVQFGVEAQEVDDSGTPVGNYISLGYESVTAGTTTPQRFSYRYGVTPARYRVRLRRTTSKPTATGYNTTMVWASLRAYLPETTDFGNITLLAMRLKASNQLSMQASRKINVIATRKLYTWHPTNGWSSGTVATRSIAWALADILKADYGAKLADARIDLDALYALDQTWTLRDDHLDGRFDSADVIWNALTTAAIAGRTKPYIQGGIVHFARDQAQAFPVALFSMRNIVKNSFSIDYIMSSEETADAVDVTYFSDVNWAPQHVLCELAGGTSLKPAKLNLFGVTDRDHAHREGLYYAGANKYRRKLIRFATEMEGFIPSYGDLIAVQHDMPQWGQHAEVTAVQYISNDVQWSEQFNQTYWAKVQLNTTGTPAFINQAADATGAMTLEKIIATYNGGVAISHYIQRTINGKVMVNGDKYFMAATVKKADYDYVRITFAQSIVASTTLNLTTGLITSSSALASGVIDLGNGLYRLWMVDDVTDAVTYPTQYVTRVTLLDSTGAFSFIGDDAKGTYAGQMQACKTTDLLYKPYVKTPGAASDLSSCVLTLTEKFNWNPAATHYIGVRKKNGGMEGPIAVDWAGPDAVALVDSHVYEPYAGLDYERTHITFGWGATWRQEARVIAVRPRGTEQVEIECINEDPSVHTADTGVTAPPVNSSQLSTLYTAPVIAGLTARSAPDDVNFVLLSWQAASGAEYYIIEQSADGETWGRVAETRANNFAFRVSFGSATVMRVCAVGLTKGPWVTIAYGSVADYMWDVVTTELMWDTVTAPGDGSAVYMWR